MALAPGEASQARPMDARDAVGSAAREWAQTVGISTGTGGRLQVALPDEPLGVMFDVEHLRRVLVNLLDNAARHAGGEAGAIVVQLESRDAERAVLHVISDGDLISPEVERHLFEPFFSTRSRGSGLGLYICRELCERYGASIDFRPRPADERLRNEFVVVLRRAALTVEATPLPSKP